ncbi:MAG: transporter substrate-binding domain-containing protein [Cellvibrionaceae bacterium]
MKKVIDNIADNLDGDESVINVGVLFSHSGSMSVTEEAHLQGTLLAISEINEAGGVSGKKISPIIENPNSDPVLCANLAKKILLSGDDVPVIFGCCSSASRKATLPVVERSGCLLFYPSFYEGFEYSQSIYYTGATPNQTAIPLIEYLLNNYGKNFYLVGSDYVYPHEVNRIVKEFLEESGGNVLGEEYININSDVSEYRNVVSNIKRSNADVIFSTVVGLDTVNLYNSYSELGMDSKITPIASLTTSEGELSLLDSKAKKGHITGSVYFSNIQAKENVEFVARFKEKFGDNAIPNVYSTTAYLQVYLFAKAMSVVGDNDIDKIATALSSLSMGTPLGTVSIDAISNHLNLRPRIGRSTSEGVFDIVWESENDVVPDPYLVAYNRELMNKTKLYKNSK